VTKLYSFLRELSDRLPVFPHHFYCNFAFWSYGLDIGAALKANSRLFSRRVDCHACRLFAKTGTAARGCGRFI
jgi:hypothetical protein